MINLWWRSRRTHGKWRPLDRKQPGAVPDWFRTVSEWPDCIIEPQEYVSPRRACSHFNFTDAPPRFSSFVIEIKASEIVRGGKSLALAVLSNSADHHLHINSDDYAAGLTLRFPRKSVSTIRDKALSDQFATGRCEEYQQERSGGRHGLRE